MRSGRAGQRVVCSGGSSQYAVAGQYVVAG